MDRLFPWSLNDLDILAVVVVSGIVFACWVGYAMFVAVNYPDRRPEGPIALISSIVVLAILSILVGFAAWSIADTLISDPTRGA